MKRADAAYYNEIDPYAAQWLRNLITAGHIAPGDVDERSIEDVRPDDLRGYTQCHFFAGIGVWSYALRRAGFPDDRPVWTGSCPCQPFSAAGKGAGFDDERHLWPAWHWLISECRPARILGEQVASSAVNPWLDLVQADVEALDYAFGCVPFPSAGVGAPHIRDRAYWLAYADDARSQGRRAMSERAAERAARPSRLVGGVADSHGRKCGGIAVIRWIELDGQDAGRAQGFGESESRGDVRGMADSDYARFCGEQGLRLQGAKFHDADGCGPVGGFWADADWLPCRDGKWRPVEPGTFPLVDGAPSRVGRLRAYGNAINASAAQAFVESVMEVM